MNHERTNVARPAIKSNNRGGSDIGVTRVSVCTGPLVSKMTAPSSGGKPKALHSLMFQIANDGGVRGRSVFSAVSVVSARLIRLITRTTPASGTEVSTGFSPLTAYWSAPALSLPSPSSAIQPFLIFLATHRRTLRLLDAQLVGRIRVDHSRRL